MKRSVSMSLSLAAVSLGAIVSVGLSNNQSATAQVQQSQLQEQPQEQPQAQPKVGCDGGSQAAGQTI